MGKQDYANVQPAQINAKTRLIHNTSVLYKNTVT